MSQAWSEQQEYYQQLSITAATLKEHGPSIFNPEYRDNLQRHPGWQALSKLPDVHFGCVSTLECVFEDIFNIRHPQRGEDMLKHIFPGPYPEPVLPISKSQNTIYGLTLDQAITEGLITEAQANELLGDKPWKNTQYEINEVIRVLENDLKIVAQVMANCREAFAVPQPSKEISQP